MLRFRNSEKYSRCLMTAIVVLYPIIILRDVTRIQLAGLALDRDCVIYSHVSLFARKSLIENCTTIPFLFF